MGIVLSGNPQSKPDSQTNRVWMSNMGNSCPIGDTPRAHTPYIFLFLTIRKMLDVKLLFLPQYKSHFPTHIAMVISFGILRYSDLGGGYFSRYNWLSWFFFYNPQFYIMFDLSLSSFVWKQEQPAYQIHSHQPEFARFFWDTFPPRTPPKNQAVLFYRVVPK